VQVARAELGTIARSLAVSGVVEPIRTVGVNSQMSGALLAVQVEEGVEVRQGQILARLDDRELRAQLAAAEAAFQVAESAHARAEQLRDRQVITLPEYERDRTAHAAAKAQLDQVRTRLDYATIAAPIAGVITGKFVEAGDIVGSQSRIFTLADLSTMVVPVQVSELDVVSLAVGNSVDVALDAFPGRMLQGKIRRIFPSADPTTRLVPVEVALEGDSAHLARPGFLARVTFALGEHRNVILVPASALVRGGQSQAVFVVEEGRASRREVTTGLTSRGQVEILTGLAALESVVTVGNNTLQDGATVRVLGRNEAGADSTAPAAQS
jgi:RND family efflux transporter MFP subunit